MDNKFFSSRNSRAVPKQFEKLLEIVSAPGVLDSENGGHITYKHMTKHEFWKGAASQLNSVPGGVYKNPFKWCKMWCDWKHNTKCKLRRLKSATKDTKSPLSSCELQLLKLLKVPLDSLESDDGLEQIDQQYTFEVVDFVQSDNETREVEMDDKSKIEICIAENDDSEENKFKRRKLTSPEPKNVERAAPAEQSDSNNLERHKLRQKDEELRLRAIELKLKHQELKLKEAEMTKVNSLVNIEEEKLRCFQDIAGMLKELVDRTKNGHPPKYIV